jgi:DNA-binding MarR family transcriptional regulator
MLGALLGIPFQAVIEHTHAALRTAGYHDLTRSHLVFFQYLPPEGDRLTGLAEAAQLTKQSMGYLADFLQSGGYIERVPDPNDRRARLILLTEKGRHVERIARQAIAELTAEWAEHVGRERMHELEATLQLLVELLASTGARNHAKP